LAGGVLHPWVRHEPEYFRIAASIENNRKQLRNFRGRVRMPTRKERRPLEKAPRHECRGGRHECLRHESDPKITLSLVAFIAQWPAPRKNVETPGQAFGLGETGGQELDRKISRFSPRSVLRLLP